LLVNIPLPATWSPGFKALFVVHAALLGLLLLGAVFRNPIGELLRQIATMLLFLGAFGALVVTQFVSGPDRANGWYYGFTVAILLVVYGGLLRDLFAITTGGIALVVGGSMVVIGGYRSARATLPGLDYLSISLAVFAIAILVSLSKGGLLGRRRITRNEP
jgi:hypothetical protein